MSPPGPARPLLFCNILALDRRWISAETTPYLGSLLGSEPVADLRGFPSSDTITSLLLGCWPTEHGYWHVQLNLDAETTRARRIFDALPDGLNRTLGCLAFLIDDSRDLAAVPSGRRRRFHLKRYKQNFRGRRVENAYRIGEMSSFLAAAEHCGRSTSYSIPRYLREARDYLGEACTGGFDIECVEVRFLDNGTHWSLDREDRVRELYGEADRLVKDLHGRCRDEGYSLLLMSGHGQERVRHRIDLAAALRGLGLGKNEYTHFMELPMARFWFHSDRARAAVEELLGGMEHVETLRRREMEKYGFTFSDDRLGELFAFADPGYVFFPHDFYHPLANLFMAAMNPLHRRRLLSPVLRGVHGYLPGHPSERAFLTLLDHPRKLDRLEGKTTDVAPTILRLSECPVPSSMTGTSLVSERERTG
ncbi:MAG: hypothetical protein ABIK65_11930 [Candidatus Eisenbacteria bacterium]